jgi:fibro-slime domain-containing protein
MSMSRPFVFGLLGAFFVALYACAGSPPSSSSIFVSDAGHDGTVVGASPDDGPSDSTAPIPLGDDAPQQDALADGCAAATDACAEGPTGYCGDGVLDAGEQCDDGNARPGDGCSGACQIEPGWACPTPGQPCVKIWVCGNGRVDPGEQCDDNNTVSGDGCSSTCLVEPGYACPNRSGVGGPCIALKANVCGDGIVAGAEQCDDGNTVSGDGCSSTCMVEPGYTCTPGLACKKIEFCGDGIVQLDIGEQCDDGNMVSGDGCSSLCKLEPNFVCLSPGKPCTSTIVCGDGKVQGSEQCDDGNTVSGDGCSSSCQLEAGWVCPVAGAPCVAKACGDGIIAGSEQCDDGNTTSNDGCSATCQFEPGFACVNSTTASGGADGGADGGAPAPATTCHATKCGDGIKEGSEQCDDHNLIPYDGCSPTCTIDPKCNGVGQCTAVCGDGLVEPPEECDLGGLNGTRSGCSATCMLDPASGWYCSNSAQAPPAQLVIPILYRDMLYWNTGLPGATGSAMTFPTPRPAGGGHPDFNCGPGHCGPDAVSTGEVGPLFSAAPGVRVLGADGKPVFAFVGNPPTLTDPVSFCWWYHDTGCGDGGANPFAKPVYLDLLGHPTTLTLTQGTSGTYTYSNKQFFPLDGLLGWNAGTNPQLDTDCEPGLTNAPRNFSFTSELHYIFTYQASIAASAAPAVFDFTGDDDVWGFINNELVIDLGGVHSPANGTFTLNLANAAALGLVDGGWYSIDLFQAEAHVCRSTYALTLSNFAHVVTQCHTICGDGIVEGTEQCDPGTSQSDAGAADAGASDGGAPTVYGGCNSDCTRGPYCGDGIVQSPPEQCDDGVNLTPYGGLSKVCGPGCRFAPYCGDGVVSNGEQCDEGALNGSGYGHCTSSCHLGPRCGDGQLQSPPEQCDDGMLNGTSGSKCNADCTFKCGDGVLDPGEQCDLGAANNVGGYGGCNPDCTLGPYCGDGVLENPPEQCDYGTLNNTGGYGGCNKDCTLGPYCGDGVVENPPETCDQGPNNTVVAAAYGMGVCTTACVPAPYCGDGIVQSQFGEKCDSTVNCNGMCQPTGPQ